MRHHQWLVAAVALSAAVLCKETAAYAVGLPGCTRLAFGLRRRRLLEASDVAWIVPMLVFVAVLLAAGAARGIWLGDVGFRSLDLTYLFSWLLMLGSPYRLRWLLATTAAAWAALCVELVLFV